MNNKYSPISCQLYDRLEEFAVKKIKIKINYFDENCMENIVEDFIIDLKTKKKEEFLILLNKLEIRLDRIKYIEKI